MVQQMLTKIDYTALKAAYLQIYDTVLPVVTIHHPHLLQYLPAVLPDEIPKNISITPSQQDQQQNNNDEHNDNKNEVDEIDPINQDTTATTIHNNNNIDDNTDDVDDTDDNGGCCDRQYQLLLYKTLFCVLFEIHILEGILICPDTQREFVIKDGIPNMILHEDEL